jgi:diadenosine tetraphosphate (Ap4A) HIT family hydrolase
MKKCIFCDPDYQKNRNAIENECFFANFDDHPVTEGHMKLITKRHTNSFFDLTEKEIKALFDLLKMAKKWWMKNSILMAIMLELMMARQRDRQFFIYTST